MMYKSDLANLRKGKPIGDGTRLELGRAMSLGGSTPSPSALIASQADRPGTGFPSLISGFDSRGALSGIG
jgi:hypothetical protein